MRAGAGARSLVQGPAPRAGAAVCACGPGAGRPVTPLETGGGGECVYPCPH